MEDNIYTDNHSRTLLLQGEHKGYRYFIVTYGTHPCAYVENKGGHKNYMDDELSTVEVHGGFTFLGEMFETDCLGWDYIHFGDYIHSPYVYSSFGKKWTIEEIHLEVIRVIDQLIDISEKEIKEMPKFRVGDKVFYKILGLEGEVFDYDEKYNKYLVGFKRFKGHDGFDISKDKKLEIEQKGYKGQCWWCTGNFLELLKDDKEMPGVKNECKKHKLSYQQHPDPVGETGLSCNTWIQDKQLEMVNHPQHYAFKYEPIDVINDWGLDFNLGNTVKYIARCERKGNKLQDLEKAKFYLEDEIRRLKENGIK